MQRFFEVQCNLFYSLDSDSADWCASYDSAPTWVALDQLSWLSHQDQLSGQISTDDAWRQYVNHEKHTFPTCIAKRPDKK